MEAHNEPSEEEADFFLSSFPSKPRMIARTNCGTPYQPMTRVLAPIADADIVSQWSDTLRQKLLFCIQSQTPQLQWTGFFPVRMEARPGAWDTFPPESGNFLFLTVIPGTTGWHDALNAALDCKAVMKTHGIANMDVVVAEMDLVAPGGLDGADGPMSAAPAKNNVELQDMFDVRFSSPSFNHLFSDINLAVLPFLPLPGQSLQPLDASDADKELPAGSLGCFVRLEDDKGNLSDTVYALTSRHVAVQGTHDDHSVLTSPSDITIACGSMAVINKKQVILRGINRARAAELNSETKTIFSKDPPSDDAIARLELLTECAHTYLDAMQEGLDALGSRDGRCPRTRHVGTVAYAAEHSINMDGFWKDWALVAVSPSDAASATQCKHFFKSNVFMGHWPDVVRRIDELLEDNDVVAGDYTTPLGTDDAHLLTLKAPHPPMTPWGRATDTALRPVYKRGATSGLTVGLLSPIEAVLRRPLRGVDVIAWAWPVFGSPMHPEMHHKNFSWGGDSGSIVFDTAGVMVGMVDAGFGSTTHVQQNQDPAAAPTQLPPISAARRAADSKEDHAQIDISLLTPLDQIFKGIKEVTGCSPRVV